MRLGTCLFPATLLAAIALLALPSHLFPQESGSGLIASAADTLPDPPEPGPGLATAPASQQASAGQDQNAPHPAETSSPAPAQDSSSSQTSAPQATPEKSQHDKAEEQVKEQEKQRMLGIIPTFNTTYRSDAVSLTAGQKMNLALHSAVDPWTFGISIVVAGYHEALDDDTGFGWGAEGFGKRAGAAYLDAFDGTIIGNAFLPIILHQDPRYFRLGHGTATHRVLYALASNVMCKHDHTGKWEPNYSNVGGNIISGAISNLYYPSSESGVGETITNGLTVTAEGGLGSLLEEFWPDISRKFLHKDPTNGLDAEARAADKAEKEARKEARQNQK